MSASVATVRPRQDELGLLYPGGRGTIAMVVIGLRAQEIAFGWMMGLLEQLVGVSKACARELRAPALFGGGAPMEGSRPSQHSRLRHYIEPYKAATCRVRANTRAYAAHYHAKIFDADRGSPGVFNLVLSLCKDYILESTSG